MWSRRSSYAGAGPSNSVVDATCMWAGPRSRCRNELSRPLSLSTFIASRSPLHLDRLADRLDLLELGPVALARAHDAEAAGADLRVADDRQPADLLPAQALYLERVHPHLRRREG